MAFNPRRRRRRRGTAWLRRLFVVAAGFGAFVVALFTFIALSSHGVSPAESRDPIAASSALLRAGNPTAARAAALQAVRAAPGNGTAHLALARAMLVLGDGIGAEGELDRAVAAGVEARLVSPLRAHALLLQGDPGRALAEADKAAPRFAVDALRIRGRALAALGRSDAAWAAFNEAARRAPRDAAVWSDIGRFRYRNGDMIGAIEAATRANRLDPNAIEALVLRGELVRSQYGLVASLPWFEAALQHDPAYHDALIEYAATLGDAGRSIDALAATRRALAARRNSPQAYYLQAVIAARAGDHELARRLIEKTGGVLAGLPGMLLLGGVIDIEQGDYEQAVGKLRQLVAQQPMNITARKLLATALLRTDSARNAIDMLHPVIARADADPYALTLAARGFERMGDRASANALLDRAARPGLPGATPFSADDSLAVLAGAAARAPNDPAIAIPYIRALLASGNQGMAFARAQAIAAANPGMPGAQLLLGDLLMLRRQPADAAQCYARAADLRFDEATMLRLVEALEAAGKRGEAANALALFLSQNPVNLAALRLSGQWQLAAGDYDAAAATFEMLRARVGDGDAAIDASLAVAYAGIGENALAREFGEAAYGLAPANPAIADAFGWALFRNGDSEGARQLLEKAVALAPGHAALRWHLAQILVDLGQRDAARGQARAALADPGFPDRAAALALLAS